jgi:KRAB domain-containing zinc finger protein
LFAGKRELVVHQAREHSRLDQCAHECHVCAKRFAAQQKLEQHMRTHSGERPFGCTECDKRFARKDKLLEHFRQVLVPVAVIIPYLLYVIFVT